MQQGEILLLPPAKIPRPQCFSRPLAPSPAARSSSVAPAAPLPGGTFSTHCAGEEEHNSLQEPGALYRGFVVPDAICSDTEIKISVLVKASSSAS